MESRFSVPMAEQQYKDLREGKLTYERIIDKNGVAGVSNHRCWLFLPGLGPLGLMREHSCLVCAFCRAGEYILCPMSDICGPWKLWQSQLDKESEQRVSEGVPKY